MAPVPSHMADAGKEDSPHLRVSLTGFFFLTYPLYTIQSRTLCAPYLVPMSYVAFPPPRQDAFLLRGYERDASPDPSRDSPFVRKVVRRPLLSQCAVATVGSLNIFRFTAAAVKTVYAKEGFLGLFRGIVPATLHIIARDVVGFFLLRHGLAFTVACYRAVADGTTAVLSFFVPSLLFSRSAISSTSAGRTPPPSQSPVRCVGAVVSAVDDAALEVDSLRDPSEQAAEVASDIASLTRSALGSSESLPLSLEVPGSDRAVVAAAPHQGACGARRGTATDAQDPPPAVGFVVDAEPLEDETDGRAGAEMIGVSRLWPDTRGREIAPVILKLLTECAVYPLLTVATRMVVIEGPPYSPTLASLSSLSASLPAPLATVCSFFVPKYLHVTMLEMVRLTYAADGIGGFYGGLLPFLLSRCVDDSVQALMRLFIVDLSGQGGKKGEGNDAAFGDSRASAALLQRRSGPDSEYPPVWATRMSTERREDEAGTQVAAAPPFARIDQADSFEPDEEGACDGIETENIYQIPRESVSVLRRGCGIRCPPHGDARRIFGSMGRSGEDGEAFPLANDRDGCLTSQQDLLQQGGSAANRRLHMSQTAASSLCSPTGEGAGVRQPRGGGRNRGGDRYDGSSSFSFERQDREPVDVAESLMESHLVPPRFSFGSPSICDTSCVATEKTNSCPQGERNSSRWSPRRVTGYESNRRRPQTVGEITGAGSAERPVASTTSRTDVIDDSLHQVEMYTMRACFAAVLSTAVTPFSQLALVQRCQSNLEGLCMHRSWLDVLAGMPWKTFFLQFAVSLSFLILNSLMAATLHENEAKRKVREVTDEEGDDFLKSGLF
ncbi:hypothetical protein TGME49_276900 [Toxoplasma gondii ME49]|uniref:Transmembrane protein n=3 Tax=Toxoplasma gondii TaxID=5811 RepID=A0A125YMN6_TOXGV|nr:hypothetical protein TGME49_276900 [Toxoplasma gondii ME49]EPT25426.1 hypothetical protein TGME49_276900 [Toxoplasma gondii ME49]ESS34671.1 putative transmembrane protein [Toxoplasma gondii VEG]|eukprot:XP_018635179.1 hypothetical protein TGME49_276900 [Toxoplasma gondii ME49]